LIFLILFKAHEYFSIHFKLVPMLNGPSRNQPYLYDSTEQFWSNNYIETQLEILVYSGNFS